MAKIICDYCEFGTKDKLCYKGGMDKCQGELFVCRQNTKTGERQLIIPDVSRSFVGLFMHYDNGDMVNIQDLSKTEYEKFLEQMNALRIAYITLVSRP